VTMPDKAQMMSMGSQGLGMGGLNPQGLGMWPGFPGAPK
jgi:hypothetical protein